MDRHHLPWTSPRAPLWKRVTAWAFLLGVSLALFGLMLAKPIVWVVWIIQG